MLLPWLTLFDYRGIFANLLKKKNISYRKKCDEFAILVPIFNDVKYLSNIILPISISL